MQLQVTTNERLSGKLFMFNIELCRIWWVCVCVCSYSYLKQLKYNCLALISSVRTEYRLNTIDTKYKIMLPFGTLISDQPLNNCCWRSSFCPFVFVFIFVFDLSFLISGCVVFVLVAIILSLLCTQITQKSQKSQKHISFSYFCRLSNVSRVRRHGTMNFLVPFRSIFIRFRSLSVCRLLHMQFYSKQYQQSLATN